ncbi:MAG: SIMPL domain-containing protein, partial [Hyphomicrobiaceae bacterium]
LGATQIGGLSFDIADPAALRDAARKQAVDLARKRAELYAEAAGAKVGEVLTISEGGVAQIPRDHGFARAALAESVPIERGSQQVEVVVTVTWALK